MDVTRVQAKINKGEGIAARVLGLPHTIYRPVAPFWPLDPSNAMGTIKGWQQPDFTFRGRVPSLYGKPILGLLCDRSALAVGDYLVRPDGTFFVIALQSLLATAVVQCNRVLRASRPGRAVNGYGGVQTESQEDILAGWPASVTQGTKGERTDPHLPGDPRGPWVQILLPALSWVQIRFGDFFEDDQAIPQRYTVSSAELTDAGYRITASLAVT